MRTARTVGLGLALAVAALVAAFTLANVASTKEVDAAPAPKVLLCHYTGSESNPVVVIEVSQNAVPAHLKNHGDAYASFDDDGELVCTPPPVIGPGGG